MKVTDWFDPYFQYDHGGQHPVTGREAQRLEDEQYEIYGKLGKQFKPKPVPTDRWCIKCYATIEVKDRVPYDWRLTRLGHFEPGTDRPHRCKKKPRR